MNYTVALVIGQAIGFKCLKKICEYKKIKIKYVISSDAKYNKAIKNFCKKEKIKFFKKNIKLNRKIFLKQSLRCDFLLSAYTTLIFKENFLNLFKLGCYNFHPAILPYYPGINPISGMIYNGEKKIGVTLHKMTKKIDAGKIIFLKKAAISQNDNLFSCMKKIEKLTIIILLNFLKTILKGKKFKEIKNDVSKRKKFPKKIPKKGVLNFNWTYKIFLKHFNAGYSDPYRSHWGKIFFIYKGKKKTIYNFVCAKKTTKLKLKKIYKNIFDIKLKNKTIRAET